MQTADTTYIPELYHNVLDIDETSGLPADWESFFIAYRPLAMATAARLKIPEDDKEDAAHNVMEKFWQKDGLSMFDPNQNTVFATLFRKWATMFMLQERDKVKRAHRVVLLNFTPTHTGVLDSSPPLNFEPDVLSSVRVIQWVQAAEQALEAANRSDLLPLLRLCVEAAETGSAPSRQQIADATKVKIHRANAMQRQLVKILTDAGLGMESLYD